MSSCAFAIPRSRKSASARRANGYTGLQLILKPNAGYELFATVSAADESRATDLRSGVLATLAVDAALDLHRAARFSGPTRRADSRRSTNEQVPMEADALRQEAARRIAAQDWLALGTVDPSGSPSVTYVPFACVDGALGIVVSRLAAHTANLIARRPASVLIADEDFRQRDAYARPRITIAVTASPRAPGSAEAEGIWSSPRAAPGRYGAHLAGCCPISRRSRSSP